MAVRRAADVGGGGARPGVRGRRPVALTTMKWASSARWLRPASTDKAAAACTEASSSRRTAFVTDGGARRGAGGRPRLFICAMITCGASAASIAALASVVGEKPAGLCGGMAAG